MKNHLRVFLIFIIFSAFIYIQKLEAKKPGWIDNPPIGHFVGVSLRHDSEKEARNDAMKGARKQIIDSLGVKLSKETEEEIVTEGKTDKVLSSDVWVKTKVKITSKSIIAVKPEEYHIQKVKQLNKRDKWKAYVLVYFPEEKHRIFMKEMANENKRISQHVLENALNYFNEGNIGLAVSNYSKVIDITSEIIDISGMEPSRVSELRRMRIESLDNLKRIISDIKRKLAQIKITIENKSKLEGNEYPFLETLNIPIEIRCESTKDKNIKIPISIKSLKGNQIIEKEDVISIKGVAKTSIKRFNTIFDENIIVAELDIWRLFSIDWNALLNTLKAYGLAEESRQMQEIYDKKRVFIKIKSIWSILNKIEPLEAKFYRCINAGSEKERCKEIINGSKVHIDEEIRFGVNNISYEWNVYFFNVDPDGSIYYGGYFSPYTMKKVNDKENLGFNTYILLASEVDLIFKNENRGNKIGKKVIGSEINRVGEEKLAIKIMTFELVEKEVLK